MFEPGSLVRLFREFGVGSLSSKSSRIIPKNSIVLIVGVKEIGNSKYRFIMYKVLFESDIYEIIDYSPGYTYMFERL